MTIIGEGVYRDCMGDGCGVRLGCHHPSGITLDCGACREMICPDTSDISHGLCDECYVKARRLNAEKRMMAHA